MRLDRELLARWRKWMHTLIFAWVGVSDDLRSIGRSLVLAAKLFAALLIRFLLMLVLPLSALVIAYLDLRDERKRVAKQCHFGG